MHLHELKIIHVLHVSFIYVFSNKNHFSYVPIFKIHRLFTWTSPDRTTKNQIDYILVPKRWRTSLFNAKTYPGADCGSDHELLIATIQIKKRKIKKPTAPIRFNLTKIPQEYGVEVSNKFDILISLAEEKNSR